MNRSEKNLLLGNGQITANDQSNIRFVVSRGYFRREEATIFSKARMARAADPKRQQF